MEKIDQLAKIIWDYHRMHMTLKKSDAIFALGSHDLRVADRAAELYLKGWAPLIIFSGNRGDLTRHFIEPEAEVFAKRAIELGVPEDKIIKESGATNTGENVLLTKKLIEERSLNIKNFILVQKPYMERRTYATFAKLWPEKDFVVTSPQIDYEDYFDNVYPKDYVLNVMVGDLQRIKIYPKKGFQIYQEIPEEVWEAYGKMVQLGYNKHLVKE